MILVLVFSLYNVDEPYSKDTASDAEIRADILHEYFTAPFNYLENLFNDGGDPIDFYCIESEAKTFTLNTSEGISYNDTLLCNATMFNVTAHNCAGSSDIVSVTIYQGKSSTVCDRSDLYF